MENSEQDYRFRKMTSHSFCLGRQEQHCGRGISMCKERVAMHGVSGMSVAVMGRSIGTGTEIMSRENIKLSIQYCSQ